MKKYIGGVLALGLALFASAFTMPKHVKVTDYYWFQTNAAGTTVTEPARSDVSSTTDPSGCSAGSNFCSLGYIESKTTLDGSGHRILASGVGASDRDNTSKHN